MGRDVKEGRRGGEEEGRGGRGEGEGGGMREGMGKRSF